MVSLTVLSCTLLLLLASQSYAAPKVGRYTPKDPMDVLMKNELFEIMYWGLKNLHTAGDSPEFVFAQYKVDKVLKYGTQVINGLNHYFTIQLIHKPSSAQAFATLVVYQRPRKGENNLRVTYGKVTSKLTISHNLESSTPTENFQPAIVPEHQQEIKTDLQQCLISSFQLSAKCSSSLANSASCWWYP
eukprot:TRINITY_DN10243_c0_g1_i1.p1 TRINITY_DN10243_c0_g1~~TRINITY_DN10243_c0_g1_i1.p1  ORF type:complete len:188 (-),score=22.24 TRINITY_DN10243_c0_g1_i1:185-748(-)